MGLRQSNGCLVLTPDERLLTFEAGPFNELLGRLHDRTPDAPLVLLIDVSGAMMATAPGLGWLAACATAVAMANGQVGLCGAPSSIADSLRHANLQTLFRHYACLEHGIESLTAPPSRAIPTSTS